MNHLFPVAILLLAAMTSCSRKAPALMPGNWNEEVWSRLSTVIAEEGSVSDGYSKDCRPYAVFDFDNTSIINDCEISLMHYMIENMSFRVNPDDMFSTITTCIPDIDKPVIGDITVRMLAEDITSDYRELYGRPVEEVSDSDPYKDFRTKLSALYFVTEDCYEYKVCCEWILKLFEGMSYSEVSELAKASFDYYSAMDGVTQVVWDSPEMGQCGSISKSHYEGIHATDFDDMSVGLIINCGNGGGIGRLVASGDPRYAVQGRDLASGTFTR